MGRSITRPNTIYTYTCDSCGTERKIQADDTPRQASAADPLGTMDHEPPTDWVGASARWLSTGLNLHGLETYLCYECAKSVLDTFGAVRRRYASIQKK